MILIQNLGLSKDAFNLDASFHLPGTGVSAVFGPSGCGKTSLLRVIAGLEPGALGRVQVNGETWQEGDFKLPCHKRKVGMVFQQPSLFTHLTVRGNLAYGLERKPQRNCLSLDDLANRLGLSAKLERRTQTLSGGEMQRVALGRALLANPQLLLLDEPLSALDIEGRQELMTYLEKILQQIEIAVIYVSHSTDEVARLANYIVVLDQGRVQSSGPLLEVLADLDNPLSRAEEAFTVFECEEVNSERSGLTALRTFGGQVFYVTHLKGGHPQQRRLRIQARDVSLCLEQPANTSIINVLSGDICDISEPNPTGQRTIKLGLGGEFLLSRISDYSVRKLGLAPGSKVFAQIKSVAVLA